MDNAIIKVFNEALDIDLLQIIISNSADKDRMIKVRIRPVVIKEELLYQASEYIGQQIFHCNYGKEELLDKLPDWFEGLFRQAEITARKRKTTVLISKKGKVTVINKQVKAPAEDAVPSHNKKKNYILAEGAPLPFLVDLGVMTGDGAVVKSKSDKFRQINRFLEYIEDVLPFLNKEKELTILDFGCGKSYLTFAMYYYLKVLRGYRLRIIGLDLKAEVIRKCNELSKQYGYDRLSFQEGDIASYEGGSEVDMVVTLHACDTATDYALYKAVSWGAQVILSVPCCQHELNRQLHNDVLKPILQYGIVKERMSALITDALRAELLKEKGYKVQLLEFIDMEHTPKNILIRAVKRTKAGNETESGNENGMESKELKECMEFLQAEPCLLRLFSKGITEE
ncbi:SAM-dependent methyltransferase [Anaerotaenia torta]|uniref:class I SAM-dependent methyltransferase n=1 Tax=Anaerotaenia torta TaxID=433293 RepID=UPI003D1E2E53